jgi:hypothetical protein
VDLSFLEVDESIEPDEVDKYQSDLALYEYTVSLSPRLYGVDGFSHIPIGY